MCFVLVPIRNTNIKDYLLVNSPLENVCSQCMFVNNNRDNNSYIPLSCLGIGSMTIYYPSHISHIGCEGISSTTYNPQ